MLQTKCSSCGQRLPDGARWCPNCGSAVSGTVGRGGKPTSASGGHTAKHKRKRGRKGKSWLSVVLSVFLFVVAGVSLFVLFGNDKEKERGSIIRDLPSQPSESPASTDTASMVVPPDSFRPVPTDDKLQQMEAERGEAERRALDARRRAQEMMEHSHSATGTYSGQIQGADATLTLVQNGTELNATYSSGSRRYAASGNIDSDHQFELYVYDGDMAQARIRGIVSGSRISATWEERQTGAVYDFKLTRQ